MSLESLRFMLGGAIHKPAANESVIVRRTEEIVAGADGKLPLPKDHLTGNTLTPAATAGHPIRFINYGGGQNSQSAGARTQIVYVEGGTGNAMSANCILKFTNDAMGINEKPAAQGDHIRVFWEEVVTGASNADQAVEVTISPDTFPGTYRVVGDTFMRSEKTGKDEAFQFVIGKAKVNSEVTITLEAEGDPSTFEMTLTVLRNSNERGENEMMKLIRYTDATSSSGDEQDDHGSITPGGQ